VVVGQYDRVVFTCHANDAKSALPPSYDEIVLGGLLGSVNYTKSTAYVHQDDTILPAPELRRTYNVWIRGAGEPTNYAMTYVINQHQADRENTFDKYFDCSEYYVSLSPPKTPAKILVDENTGQPAQYDFFHNVGDLSLVSAQTRLWQKASGGSQGLQGINGIYFIGGWTVGAGLMIECWEAVQSLVGLWNGETPHAAFDKSRPGALYAPSYIRRLRPPRAGVSLSRGKGQRR
jgi:predicted NAD/FAD-binding protein